MKKPASARNPELARLLKTLNPQQKKAVRKQDGPLLIIAGAGSGKTGVITARIALMIENGIKPKNILALTFTNKAAREMNHRVSSLLGGQKTALEMGTFHSFGALILREQSALLGYRKNFTIYDSADRLTCLKESGRELGQKYEFAELKEIAALFSDIQTGRQDRSRAPGPLLELYEEYLRHLKLYNAVDFDSLMSLPVRLFTEHPEVLELYRRRYRYISVDEFQDTSLIQYKLLKLLAGDSRNICCVGDDDQSIYSWRGADYGNILSFEEDFPERIEIKLEQNYRSTGVILDAANALISHNSARKSKKLWTALKEDRDIKIQINYPEDEREESDFVAAAIQNLKLREKTDYAQIAVLVRTNNLMRHFEDAFLTLGIPYSLSGGTGFFQRKEVKDILAYLRLCVNPYDDVSLLRIINTPRRGIGKKGLEYLTAESLRRHCPLYAVMKDRLFAGDSSSAADFTDGIAELLSLIEQYTEKFKEAPREKAAVLKEFIEDIEYWGYLLREFPNREKAAKWRFDQLVALTGFLERWEKNPDNLDPGLSRWLNRISLITRDEIQNEDEGKVSLMTIHAAKGLEYRAVFLPGIEEGLLPHARSLEEHGNNIEEERRLFYVALTRAKEKLFLTSCRKRHIGREIRECRPSSFLTEIPPELIRTVTPDKEIHPEEAENFFRTMPWKLPPS